MWNKEKRVNNGEIMIMLRQEYEPDLNNKPFFQHMTSHRFRLLLNKLPRRRGKMLAINVWKLR